MVRLCIYDHSFNWDNFGSQTASYTVAYSETAATGGYLTSDKNLITTNTTILGTPEADLLFGNGQDNTIKGFAGDDFISGGAGNDTIMAGDGNDSVYSGDGDDNVDGGESNNTINTGYGNDVIVAGDGYDIVNSGSGNDSIDVGRGWANVDGGAGVDTLTFDLSNADAPHSLFYTIGGNGYAAGDSYEQLHQALVGATAFGVYGYFNVQYHNVEAVNWTAGLGNDLLIYQGGSHYDGGTGNDTFYADFSGTTQVVNWNVDTNTFSTVNGMAVTNVERLLLATGSGTISSKRLTAGFLTTSRQGRATTRLT
ncbi:calcium-binding protein [Crenothrix sp.]|uniref:calcium-binding protein n=1 Tax=Crenothrix sp. TaxID=3100433 RepID=UPI00374DE781